MFTFNKVSKSMLDAVGQVLNEDEFKPKKKLILEPEDDCVTKPEAKKIAKKEVKGHEKSMHHEETEQIDELTKSTLGSYIKKASHDATINRSIASDFEHMADKARKTSSKTASKELADKYRAKTWQRKAGIGKAVDRLTKEEVEGIDEVAPPGFEGTVKAMKKHKEIDNPYALAWYMKNKGYKSHKKD